MVLRQGAVGGIATLWGVGSNRRRKICLGSGTWLFGTSWP